MNDYVVWGSAKARAADLRAEAREARLAGALRRARRRRGRYVPRVEGLWDLLGVKGPVRRVEGVCCG